MSYIIFMHTIIMILSCANKVIPLKTEDYPDRKIQTHCKIR